MAEMRKFSQRKRNKGNRKRNPFIIIGCEGNNKTEKLYFNNFNTRNCIIKFSKGNSTDPKGIVMDLIKYINTEIDIEKEDKIYAVFDTDINQNKQFQIAEARKLAKENGIEIIISTPSFEFWFLLHFFYTTKSFSSNIELQNNLKKFIPEYSKSSNVYDSIKSFTQKAINNSKKIENYYIEQEKNWNSEYCNPYTAVYRVVEELFKRNSSS